MLNYIKKLLKKPTEIYTTRNMKTKNYFFIVLLMGISLTFLSAFGVKKEVNKISKDYQEIQASIPDYELIDDKLQSDQESYIYQTDSLVFYFDPQDEIDTQLIDQNMEKQQPPISAALQKEYIYLNVLGQSRSLKYSDFDLTTQDLKSLLNVNTFSSPLYFSIILLVLLVFNLFLYASQLLFITIFANLISFIQNSKLSFFQNAKITIVASIVPFIIMGLLNTFNLSITYQFEITAMATLILFSKSISEFKNSL